MAPTGPPSKDPRAVAFGRVVRERREELDVSPQEIATRISYNKSSVWRFERGEMGPPRDKTIEKWAAALDLDYRALLHVAGRGIDKNAFEERVLDVLDQILKEQRSGFEQLTAAIGELSRD